MRQSLITFFICLSVSLGALAQPEGVKIKERQRIPIDPIIVEGEVTGVPDGTLVEFNYRIGKAKRHSQANWVLGDTGRRNEMGPDYPPLHEFS